MNSQALNMSHHRFIQQLMDICRGHRHRMPLKRNAKISSTGFDEEQVLGFAC
jgi:hypothetical protein